MKLNFAKVKLNFANDIRDMKYVYHVIYMLEKTYIHKQIDIKIRVARDTSFLRLNHRLWIIHLQRGLRYFQFFEVFRALLRNTFTM